MSPTSPPSPPALLSRVAPVLGASVLALILFAQCSPAPAKERAAPAPGGVAVVELFTSQGCSSCPPADRLLSKLAADPAYAGRVIPLAFHVDYWDYIGWTDPFSSAAWSNRQKQYAAAWSSNRVYTPQAVINGTREMVGSGERQVRAAIDDALAAKAPVEVALAVERIAGRDAVRVSVSAKHGAALPRDAQVFVALVQNGLSTQVGRGENGGRTLRNDAVVRKLAQAFALAAAAGANATGQVELPLAAGAAGKDLTVAAFVQDPQSRAILGGAVRGLG
ncbi:MAG TPA: DUF1223 domain-containing protein [Thermoanaerobaculia bacterium]|nr:DUF1223 domain-containing protein [Thermoanaerobaculia bacterium]